MKQPATKYNNDTYGKVMPKGTTSAEPANTDKCVGKGWIKGKSKSRKSY